MKKLFSLASILLLFLVLTGCTTENETTELQKEIAAQTALISELEDEILDLVFDSHYEVGQNEILTNRLEELEEQITILQALIFDNVVTFTMSDEYGSFTSKTIGYNDEFTGNLFEILDDNFAVGYSESDYGKFIYSLDELNPKTGAYIAFSKNGEMSMVGVETITFEDGDVFSFEVMWWDMTQKAVDDAIQLFLLNQVDNYVNSTTVEYNVISALSLLGLVDNYVTVSEVETLVSDSTITTVNDYFKAIIKLNSVGINANTMFSDLNSMVTVGPYGQTAYGLLALDSNTHSTDYSAYVTSALINLDTTSPYDLGLDAGGISLVALSNYTDKTEVQALVDEYINWISTSQLTSGGVMTRDVVWGETTYPGTENAATISQVIMGLIANDINPTSSDFTKGENNLITRLLEYQTDTGSFDWAFGDEYTEDLAFSTPQAFLALVIYQTYSNTYVPVNPYNFN
ncbi:MAG: DUF4430 domain-containing protein [Candidatus Izimaplasma sp.]|nr:DUF4430 domain-containing protein [Candidatus Izimaplasma bacterium]